MSDQPSKNLDPHIVDTHLLSNPKLMALFTDYQKVLNQFPQESLIASVHNFTQHTHDPVTAESNFYQALNATDDESAVKLETVDNSNVKYEELSKTIPDSAKKRYLDTSKPPVETAKLKDVSDMDVQFIMYWVEKFRCIHDTVKQEIWKALPKDTAGGKYNNENTYFNNFSESMFSLCDDKYVKTRSAISSADFVTPREQYIKNMVEKLDAETYNTANDMSSKTSLLFGANMFRMCIDYDRDARTTWVQNQKVDPTWHADSIQVTVDPKQPHGNNNVTDSIHPARVGKQENIDAAQLKMNDLLGDMKRVLDFLDKNAINDTQTWGRFNHRVMFDRVWSQVDQSLTELREIFEETPLSTSSNQVLS